MTLLDLGRRLILPGLDAAIEKVPWGGFAHGDGKRSYRMRGSLAKAAEEGFLTWPPSRWGRPDFWMAWCLENRHPPVTRETRIKYAVLRCELWRYRVGDEDRVVIPGGAKQREIATLMRTFVTKKKALCGVTSGDVWVEGVPIEASREAASVLVDLLLECVEWRAT